MAVLIRQAARVSSSLLHDQIFSLLMLTAHLSLPVDVKIVTQPLIGNLLLLLFQSIVISMVRHYRYNHGDAYFSILASSAL
jgi:hypothetical protein